ncbi:MAG: heme A synthase [Gemmatimonadetes bacterium]|nr:heme A synthase [Gemmatimonadota bacterium]
MSLRQLARATLGYNLLIIVWGGYVRASGSGAGCGRHWPLCNGVVVPRDPAINTMIEFAHRLTSGLALVAVVWLCVAAFRATTRGHRVRRAAVQSLIFIIIEALVGAGLVLLELVADNDSGLRAVYLAVHLANTFFLLAFLTLTWLWADRPDPGPQPATVPGLARLGWFTLAAILVVGVTGAITALGDTLFPAESLRAGLAQDSSLTAHFLLRLRIIHPALAIGAALGGTWVAVRAIRAVQTQLVQTAGRWLIGLFVAQVAIGVVNLVLLVPVPIQLLHLLMADLVWVAAVGMTAGLREA